MFVLEGPL